MLKPLDERGVRRWIDVQPEIPAGSRACGLDTSLHRTPADDLVIDFVTESRSWCAKAQVLNSTTSEFGAQGDAGQAHCYTATLSALQLLALALLLRLRPCLLSFDTCYHCHTSSNFLLQLALITTSPTHSNRHQTLKPEPCSLSFAPLTALPMSKAWDT